MFVPLRKLADNSSFSSFSNRLRRRRFRVFQDFLSYLHKPLRIIDVGGTFLFWEQMEFRPGEDIEITIFNIEKPQELQKQGFHFIQGSATDMSRFPDNFFDVAFSNSVIEHVGGKREQYIMAKEMQRIAKNIFLQTPNRYFPLEPHFLFPFFQFFPLKVQGWLLTHFKLGWYPKYHCQSEAEKIAKSIRLLSKSELKKLFTDANILNEKVIFFNKSFIITG